MVDQKIAQLIAPAHIAVVQPHIELMRHKAGGHAEIQKALVGPAQPARHRKRPLVALDEVHKVRLDEQHLMLGELLLLERHAAVGRNDVRQVAGLLGDVVELGAGIRVEDVGDGAVGLDARVELDGLERAVDVLVRQADDVVGKLRDAVFVEPPAAIDDHFVGHIALEVLKAFQPHIDGIAAGLLHPADGVLGENVEADVAGEGQVDLLLVQLDEFVEPRGEHIENGVAEVDEFDVRMLFQQRFQIEDAVLRAAEARVNFLVRIHVAELRVAAVGAVEEAAAAHHHDGRVDLGGLEVVIIEQVEIGDRDAVKVGKQRAHGVFDKAAVLVLEPERLDGGVILPGAHFVAELQLGVFPVADADAVDLGHGEHFAGHEGAVIAAADDEHVRPDLARPADIKLRVGEGGGADGKADDVKLPLFAQLFLELGFLVQIQQMQQRKH